MFKRFRDGVRKYKNMYMYIYLWKYLLVQVIAMLLGPDWKGGPIIHIADAVAWACTDKDGIEPNYKSYHVFQTAYFNVEK